METTITMLLLIILVLSATIVMLVEKHLKESSKASREFLELLDEQDRAYNKQTNAMSKRHQQRVSELLDRIVLLQETLEIQKKLLEDCHKHTKEKQYENTDKN